MSDFENNYETIEELLNFDPDLSDSKFNNQRLATRYIRNDIKGVFYKIDFFTSVGFNFFRRLIPIQILDISSRGVLVSTDKKFKIDTKIVLGLKFRHGKSFRIKAEVVRKSTVSDYEYGIKFDEYNNELGDCLVETQSELKFK
jgi:hypothetical protein